VWIAVIMVAALLLFALHPIVFACAGRWLDVGEQLRAPVDCVMVLGGESSTRPFLAAAIFRAGYARQILFAKPFDPVPGVEGGPPAEHELVRKILITRGVPPDAIHFLDGPVNSTRDEAMALSGYLGSNPKVSVAIVTSNFHTRRVRLLFRRQIPSIHDRLHFVSCPTDDFGPDNWWRYKDGVVWYVAEYVKLFRDYLW
jgi:uncharacterized SAM-binding protein YcdF (DUF218 family)